MARQTIADINTKLEQANRIIEGQTKEIVRLNKTIESVEASKDVVSKINYDTLLKDFDNLQQRYITLQTLYEKEKSKKKTKKHNERGAGRKRMVQDGAEVNQLRKEGRTVKVISEQLGVSIATVNRILKRNYQN